MSTRNFLPSADECDNNLLVSNSAYTSLCAVKVKHSSEVSAGKSVFLTGVVAFNWALESSRLTWLEGSVLILEYLITVIFLGNMKQ